MVCVMRTSLVSGSLLLLPINLRLDAGGVSSPSGQECSAVV